jgi:exodeoxyribonuclease V alpha subunit
MTLMDKVIHLKNTNMKVKGFDEPVRIYNGQLGVITVIDKENQTVTVRYPLNKQTVVYEEKHVRQGILGLSWALTIHKTQGAEFSKVVIPLTMSHFKMLNNKLLYTGVTRAKEDLQLIGEVRALDYASTNNESIQRRTVLPLAA